MTIFRGILEGVQIIHNSNICHADLKLENVVVDGNLKPKIIDFDLSIQLNQIGPCRGTLDYMDPNII